MDKNRLSLRQRKVFEEISKLRSFFLFLYEACKGNFCLVNVLKVKAKVLNSYFQH